MREEKITKFFFTNILIRLSEVVVLLEGKLLTYKKTFNRPLSKMNIHLLSQVWIKIIVQFDSEFFLEIITTTPTAQKMKFSIKDFFSKCDQIRSFLRLWSHLLKKSLMENVIFLQCPIIRYDIDRPPPGTNEYFQYLRRRKKT